MYLKKHFNLLLVSSLITLATHPIFGQVHTEKRVEFELDEGYENYNVTPIGKDGVMIYAHEEKGTHWRIQRYDNDLVAAQKKDIDVPKAYVLKGSVQTESDLTLLFMDRKGSYILYHILSADLTFKKFSGKLPKKTYYSNMVVGGDNAYIWARSKSSPFLMRLNLESGKVAPINISISAYSPKYLFIDNVQAIKETGETMVYVIGNNKKDSNMFAIELDENGSKVNTISLSGTTDKKLSSASASSIGGNNYIFTGTYSGKSANLSEGMYICKVEGSKVDFIKFYNFLDFNEFLNYLPKKTKEHLEKKKERKEDNDKEFSVNYFIADHEIVQMDGKYILIGEAYYPTYHTETRTSMGTNGQMTTTTVQVFDGYQYTHATIAAFDDTGAKVWDKTFEMWPSYKPYYVKRFITVSTENDQISLMFGSYNTIKSFSIDGNGEVANDKSLDLVETGGDDKVKSSLTNVQYWYDNYFIAHGYQTLKNDNESFGNKKRKVYYINKISYEL